MSQPCRRGLAETLLVSAPLATAASPTFRCPDLRAPWARQMAAGRLAREGLGLEVSDLRARISCALRVRKPVLRSLESSWGLRPGASPEFSLFTFGMRD